MPLVPWVRFFPLSLLLRDVCHLFYSHIYLYLQINLISLPFLWCVHHIRVFLLWSHDHTVWSVRQSYLELDLEPVDLSLLLVDHVGHLPESEYPLALELGPGRGIVAAQEAEVPYDHLFTG